MTRNIAYFLDFKFDTENVTFRPRPETELLVERACGFIPKDAPCDILDICTGCGNIAISLTKYMPSSRIVASDVSDTALCIARENAARYGVNNRIKFIKSDIFACIEKAHYNNFFDLIISNPPYVSLEDLASLSPETKEDPYLALFGGRDGMDFYRRIIKDAPFFLKTQGVLLMEMGYNQSGNVKEMLRSSGAFKDVEIYKDYSGIDRIVKAVKWKGL